MIPTGGEFFNVGVDEYYPATPDATYWEVNTSASFIDSGVLTQDVTNDWAIFTGHHVLVSDGGSPVAQDHTEFRWYVIDPDLDGFPDDWHPQIVVVGVAPTSSGSEETYQGVIGVADNGVAMISYTKSSPTPPAGWPSPGPTLSRLHIHAAARTDRTGAHDAV